MITLIIISILIAFQNGQHKFSSSFEIAMTVKFKMTAKYSVNVLVLFSSVMSN